MNEPRPPDPVLSLIEAALRAAPPRPQPSADAMERVQARAHREWQDTVRRHNGRRRRRTLARLAIAASLAACAWFVWQHSMRDAGSVAFVEKVIGGATLSGDSFRAAIVNLQTPVQVGTHIETHADGRLALRSSSGHSIRLDLSTRLRVVGRDEYALEAGRVYVDTGDASGARALRIATPLGQVSDIGTQFQVRWTESSLSLSVREGAVELDGGGARLSLVAGEALRARAGLPIERSPVAAFGDEWLWAAQLSSAADVADPRLEPLLDWVCRELGYRLRYADETTRLAATRVQLDGSFAGLTPQQTLDVLSRITRFRYRVAQGELTLESLDVSR